MSILNGVRLEKGLFVETLYKILDSCMVSSEYYCRDRMHSCKRDELRGTCSRMEINLAIILS